jgi:hypothetical protein
LRAKTLDLLRTLIFLQRSATRSISLRDGLSRAASHACRLIDALTPDLGRGV